MCFPASWRIRTALYREQWSEALRPFVCCTDHDVSLSKESREDMAGRPVGEQQFGDMALYMSTVIRYN